MRLKCVIATEQVEVTERSFLSSTSKMQTVPVEGLTKGKIYSGFLTNEYESNTDREGNETDNCFGFLIFNDDKEWAEYDVWHFEPEE